MVKMPHIYFIRKEYKKEACSSEIITERGLFNVMPLYITYLK